MTASCRLRSSSPTGTLTPPSRARTRGWPSGELTSSEYVPCAREFPAMRHAAITASHALAMAAMARRRFEDGWLVSGRPGDGTGRRGREGTGGEGGILLFGASFGSKQLAGEQDRGSARCALRRPFAPEKSRAPARRAQNRSRQMTECLGYGFCQIARLPDCLLGRGGGEGRAIVAKETKADAWGGSPGCVPNPAHPVACTVGDDAFIPHTRATDIRLSGVRLSGVRWKEVPGLGHRTLETRRRRVVVMQGRRCPSGPLGMRGMN